MAGFMVLTFVIVMLMLLPFAINPRLGWTLRRWQYQNPEANEPSEAAYTVTRVISIIAIIVVGVIGVTVYAQHRAAEEKYRRYQANVEQEPERLQRLERELERSRKEPLTLEPNAGGGVVLAFWAAPKDKELTIVYRPSHCGGLVDGSSEETEQSVTVTLSEDRGWPGVPCLDGDARITFVDLDQRFGHRDVYVGDGAQPVKRCDKSRKLSDLCAKVSKDYARERRKKA